LQKRLQGGEGDVREGGTRGEMWRHFRMQVRDVFREGVFEVQGIVMQRV
jgi:hypothetical protein